MYGKWPYQQNVDLIRSAEVKVNEEPDGTNKRRGCARTALIWHIRHPLVSILACKHTHTHTHLQTRTHKHLGQTACWARWPLGEEQRGASQEHWDDL